MPFMPGVTMYPVRLLIGVLALAATGCFGGEQSTICDDPREFHEAGTVPPLEVPEGLDAPDRSGELKMPEGISAKGYPEGRPCLERPPDYFGR